MAKILIPTALRQFTEQSDSVQVSGATVGEALQDLTTKYPNIKKNLFNDQGKLRGPWRDATARLVTDVAVISPAQTAIGKKYGWQKWLLDLGSRLTGRIRRRAWIAIDVMTPCSH